MKASKTIVAALAFLFVVSVLALSVQAAPGPQKGKQEPKAPGKASMPKEIAAVIQEGLATRQGRQDIPFSFFKQLILPAQEKNLYPVFFFKAKNGDLGYAPSASGSGQMETTLIVFFEFYQPDAAGALKPKFGGRSQNVLTTDAAGYSADKEDWYSFGLALRAGKYTLALVLSTPDMKKLSVCYSDVTLPGPEVYETTLWPTDPIIVTAMDQVEPDQRPTIHRGYFTWGAAKIVSNVNAEVRSGENLEVLFFVLGASPKDPAAAEAPARSRSQFRGPGRGRQGGHQVGASVLRALPRQPAAAPLPDPPEDGREGHGAEHREEAPARGEVQPRWSPSWTRFPARRARRRWPSRSSSCRYSDPTRTAPRGGPFFGPTF